MNSLPFFLSSILFVFFVYKWFFNNTFKSKNPPPSPRKLPLLGHLHKLGTHAHISLQSLAKQYGELMLIYLGNSPTIIASSSKMMKEITKTHDAIMSTRIKSSIAYNLISNNVDISQAPYGEFFRQLKSVLVLNLLSNSRVRSMRRVREEETALFMKNIQQNIGSSVNLSSMFVSITNDVVSRVAFGQKYSDIHAENCDFKEVLGDFMELVGSFPIGDFIPWLSWVDNVNGVNKKVKKVAASMDLILEAILRAHSDRVMDSESEDQTKDFVDVLLQIQKNNTAGLSLQREHIKALLLDVFIGGTETGSTALEWAMAELIRNPSAMEKLQKEIREIGEGKDLLTEDDFAEMKYLKAVIKEALRLHPSLPLMIPHASTQDVEINGYHIPPNTRVILNAWAIQRDPNVWENADVFRPERFLNSSIDFRGQDYELVPFGSGRRICPGIHFAIGIIELVLCNLVNKFDWKLPDGVDVKMLDMTQSPGLSIRRKNPLIAIATPHLQS